MNDLIKLSDYQSKIMTDDEFSQRYREFEDRYPVNDSRDYNARRAVELAKLIAESGWTQQRLADWFSARHPEKPKTRRWAAYQITFGHFLLSNAFGTNCSKIPMMAEGAFRKYWDRVNERFPEYNKGEKVAADDPRFAEVVRLMEAAPPVLTPTQKAAAKELGKKIVQRYTDTRFHGVETMAKQLDATPEEVRHAIHAIPKKTVVSEPRAGGREIRFIKQDQMVSIFALKEALSLEIDNLLTAAKQAVDHPAHDHPRVMLSKVQRLKTLFDRFTGDERR